MMQYDTHAVFKVLFVFSVERLGGGAAAVWMNLLDGLRKRGVAVHVVVPEGGDGSIKRALAARGVSFTELFYTWWVTTDASPHSLKRRAARMGAKAVNARAERAIAGIIAREGIDVVYICDGTITAGLDAAKAAGVPVVWHFHQFIRGGQDGISFIERDDAVARALERAARIVTVTGGQKDDLARRFGVPQEKIEAVYNGIPVYAKTETLQAECVKPSGARSQVERRGEPVPARQRCISRTGEGGRKPAFAHNPERLFAAGCTFAFIGRIDANKRPLDAVRAFEHVASTHPKTRLLIAGTGADGDVAALHRAVAASMQRERIELLGHLDDLGGVWARADIVLNCSMSEGCSMVVAEGMMRGLLVVASTADGNAELLDAQAHVEGRPQEACGLLYERGNVPALAEQMSWALGHPQAACKIALAGQRFASRAFSLDGQVSRIHAILSEACA